MTRACFKNRLRTLTGGSLGLAGVPRTRAVFARDGVEIEERVLESRENNALRHLGFTPAPSSRIKVHF